MSIKVCLIQNNPVFFNLAATLDKMEHLIRKYAAQGCELIVFPESFIPGYPRGFSFGSTIGSRSPEGRKLYQRYYDNSLSRESKEFKKLVSLSKELGVFLIIGATEKVANNGSLYCSIFYISPSDGHLGTHKKIKPTGIERLVWAEGDGKDLHVYSTSLGNIGGLICWENYMPLARMSMYQQGVEIYLAPTADARESWLSSMRHIALEGRCFVLACNQYFTKSMYPDDLQEFVDSKDEIMSIGGTVIISPLGDVIAGPLLNEAGAVIAEINLEEIIQAKLDFDPNGHYSRPDIFNFSMKK